MLLSKTQLHCCWSLTVLTFYAIGCGSEKIEFVPEVFKNVTTSAPDVTTSAPDTSSGWQGYVSAVIAILFFGSNFVPVKKFETGDGMFFQWVLCVAIWVGGLVANCIQNFPQFYPLAMLGGFLWATGNVCVVPIIKTIGLALGLLIWGAFNLLAGWASGRFGWFGLQPQTPSNTTYNDVSIVLAMISGVLWLFVKSDVSEQPAQAKDGEAPLVNQDNEPTDDAVGWSKAERNTSSFIDRLSPMKKRILGCVLSMMSGVLYGLNFTPVIYIKNNYKGSSQSDIDYVFAHFSGIFATSTLYFLIYCIYKRNKPDIYPSVILPAIVSGGMWAVADIAWFIANNYLSEAVSFPIVTTGPGLVASLWGVCVFREVKGRRNFAIMGLAYAFTIAGAVMAGLSKK